MSKSRTIYRDTKTGRFASKSTWKRSKAKSGTRYIKQSIKYVKHKPPKPPLPPLEEEVFEWIVSFTYEKTGRSFDVIVTARSDSEASQVARRFLRDDVQGQRLVAAGFTGWKREVAKGELSDEEAGEAEYRSTSRKSRRKRN